MAERRKSKKRSARQPEAVKPRSLLELPPAADPRGEPPTNPVIVVRPFRGTSLPPAPTEPMGDMSLASLALKTRRGAADLMERMSTNRPLSDYPPPASAPPPPPAPSARPPLTPLAFEAQASPTEPSPPPEPSLSSAPPPPVQIPSDRPRRRERRDGKLWLRTLGVIVLSASVGATVSSLMAEVKSELSPVVAHREASSEGVHAVAAAPACTTAAPAFEAKPVLAMVAPTLERPVAPPERARQSTPRISVDTLPLQQSRRARTPSPVAVSLDGPPPAAVAPPPRALPLQPTRAELANAVRRASSAATSCDAGPQDGAVTLTFAPSGAAQSVTLAKGFGDLTLNACVLRAFGRTRVPAFSGDPVIVRKRVKW